MTKVYAAIVAGGIGQRMQADKPKQFLNVAGKPVICHTIDKFLSVSEICEVIVLLPKDWLDYMKEEMVPFIAGDTGKLKLIEGGKTRQDTVMNAVSYVEETYGIGEDDVILTHDAVRPMVSERIIKDNISGVKKYGACSTFIQATDTIVVSEDGKVLGETLDRSKLYQCQTPQSFNIAKLKKYYEMLDDEDKKILTDATYVFKKAGEDVHFIEGDVRNIKITYPTDTLVAEVFLTQSEHK
ncbi:MAG: 2-C-methyl-D-erythritol 4-phosphate cytidylyltransferase [Lachnospiraceae bacterium]|nr:2-C-methyl-D-erythritol 4-phosphate cytidylyltransferase [Lachnospiraceae bacterium]